MSPYLPMPPDASAGRTKMLSLSLMLVGTLVVPQADNQSKTERVAFKTLAGTLVRRSPEWSGTLAIGENKIIVSRLRLVEDEPCDSCEMGCRNGLMRICTSDDFE